ncbi:MAG TPA: flagellar biosynthesis anti-sigma factor FlgM [Steroidobacter sp.]|jgi:negative regulator of flagellin synthesis FlgM|nr:flagellar biosynthesis anti-sigma factor FlgM [Steroidobacteraceae bacterium]HLS81611.1 flagellar biosynthesis anti-sigma factor FlgM [Steroidobacter sp.]
MKIVTGLGAPQAPTPAAAPARASAPSNVPAPTGEALQSAVLRPAQAAMDALPEVDEVRVAELRDALARGELPFDAAKLAALIQSHHRSGG